MADEKKIIIDEDWKAQVQAEKETAATRATGEPASLGDPGAGATTPKADQHPALPPASFEMLVTMLATEALVALGQVPHPITGKAEMEREQAQYLIDTLAMLHEKTKGNLTPAEQQLIDEVLHQMRMVFIAVTNKPAAAST